MAKIYNNPAGSNFLSSLINIIYGGDFSNLGRSDVVDNVVIYLPTARMAKSLQDEIVKLNEYKPLIMPSIKVLGAGNDEADYMVFDGLNLAEPVNKIYRRFWLADAINNYYQSLGIEISMDMALNTADSIAKLFDDMAVYETDISNIDDMVAKLDLSKHWEINKVFIEHFKPLWDSNLKDMNLCDVGYHRVATLNMLNDYIKDCDKRIIMAGFNPYFPALNTIMNTVANKDGGVVLINGYDNDLTDIQKENISNDETHPLHHIQKFVGEVEVVDVADEQPPRKDLIRQTFLSAKDTAGWKQNPIDKSSFKGVDFIEADNSFIEAMSIALKMRHSLEYDNKTTALITADRNLARLVVANLDRWDIQVDDSSGIPLHLTKSAILFRLVANVVLEDFSPASLVDLFKHPLCYRGENRGEFLRTARKFERLILRKMVGFVPLDKIEDFIRSEADNKYNPGMTDGLIDPFIAFISDFKARINPLLNLGDDDFKAMITAHIQVCENLAGADNLWAGDDGNALNKTIGDILDNAGSYIPQDIKDYMTSFTGLISTSTVRKTVGLHPRLYVWGLLEGRLQNVDSVIIGGMVEGITPSQNQTSPFLSNEMAKGAGLPVLDSAIGLTAHDLISCCNGAEITFTRTTNEGGKQTIPSRWWLRFEAVAKSCGMDKLPHGETDYISLAKNIDVADIEILLSPPKPTPPLEARPDFLSVTNIGTWYNDPYQTYAKYILGLYKEESLVVEPSPNINGNIIHKILEDFYTQYGNITPGGAFDILQEMAIKEYANYNNIVEAESIWLPRFISCIPEIIEQMDIDNETVNRYEIEKKVHASVTTDNANYFNFNGTADRIDITIDTVRVVDYKTGTVPSKTKVRLGEEPQLGLIAYALKQGGKKIEQLSYWGIKNKLEVTEVVDDKNPNIDEIAYDRLCQQIDLYADEKQPYYKEGANSRYNDYAHLYREDEWGVSADNEEGADDYDR